jgi:hypothetical protein
LNVNGADYLHLFTVFDFHLRLPVTALIWREEAIRKHPNIDRFSCWEL